MLKEQSSTDDDAEARIHYPPAGIDTSDRDHGSGIPARDDSFTLDWDSPEDPDNPHNWNKWKKVLHVATPALHCFALAAGTSSYVPAIPYIQRIYHVGRTVAILPLSLYVFGYIIGPIFSAPLSELYGRRNVYWVSIPSLSVFTAIAGATNNFPLLIVARFLAGVGGSAPLAVAGGTVTDLYVDSTARGRAALCLAIPPFLGPALGTLIGAYMIDQYHDDWRFSLWVVLMISAPILIMTAFMKETSKTRILLLRKQRRDGTLQPGQEDTKVLLRRLGRAFLRPLQMVVYEPLVATNSLYTGFAFAMVFSFLASYNYVFQSIYNFNQKEVGLSFLGILVGFLLGVVTIGICDKLFYLKAVAAAPDGVVAPENRLYAGMFGSILLPIGLFWFAWAPRSDVHWIVPILAGVPFGCGSLSVFLASTVYQVDIYGPELSSSTLAANGILRYVFGGAFPLFTLPMYENIGVHWAGTVFAFVSVVLMPVPWVFFKWGHLLRARSVFAHDDGKREVL